MIKEINTKALSNFNWGQKWVKPDGDLSVIVVVHEPFDEPIYLEKAFPKTGNIFASVTNYSNERTIGSVIQQKLFEFKQLNPNKQCVLTSHHAFIFNLIENLDFRPDMFYIYSKDNGYRRLTDCTSRLLKKSDNYVKIYVDGAFDTKYDTE